MKNKTQRYVFALVASAMVLMGAESAFAVPTSVALTPAVPNRTFTDAGPSGHSVTANASFFFSGAIIDPIVNNGPFTATITVVCGGVPQTVSSGVVAAAWQGHRLAFCPFFLPIGTSAVASLDSL